MQIEQAINSGKPQILQPCKALNKAFLKVNPNRSQIEQASLCTGFYGLTEEEIKIVESN